MARARKPTRESVIALLEEVGAEPDTAVATVAALSDAGLSYSEARSWLCHPTRRLLAEGEVDPDEW